MALEVNMDLFGFKRHCMQTEQALGHPANKEDFLMTSKLLVRLPFLLPKGRTGAKDTWTLGSLGRSAGGVGNSRTQRSPSTGDWQGELHGTFYTKASHGKQSSCCPHTPHLAIRSLQVSDGSSGWDLKAFSTLQTQRKTVPILKSLGLSF